MRKLAFAATLLLLTLLPVPARAQSVELVAYIAWTDLRMLIRSVDDRSHRCSFWQSPLFHQ